MTPYIVSAMGMRHYFGVLLCFSMLKWIISHTVVIRHRHTDNMYTMNDEILVQFTTTSPVECAQSCASRGDCKGSMLLGSTCVLYQKAQCMSPPNAVSISPDLPSRYQMMPYSASSKSLKDAMGVCQAQNMHLLAIESELEQKAIVQYIKDFRKFAKLIIIQSTNASGKHNLYKS